jgi:hypothetical protein
VFILIATLSQPFAAPAGPAAVEEPRAVSIEERIVASDPFAEMIALPTDRLRSLSGKGSAYGIDLTGVSVTQIEAVQTNSSSLTGSVTDSEVNDTITGAASGNTIANNSGFTTVFINTGNNVVLQNNVQVNIYAPATSP